MTCLTGHCVTCADEGLPMRVLGGEAGGGGTPASGGTVRCRAEDGTEREVDVALVAPVAPGDLLLVHAGVALTRLVEAPDSSEENSYEGQRKGASLSARTTGSARGARGEGSRETGGDPAAGVTQGGPPP